MNNRLSLSYQVAVAAELRYLSLYNPYCHRVVLVF